MWSARPSIKPRLNEIPKIFWLWKLKGFFTDLWLVCVGQYLKFFGIPIAIGRGSFLYFILFFVMLGMWFYVFNRQLQVFTYVRAKAVLIKDISLCALLKIKLCCFELWMPS